MLSFKNPQLKNVVSFETCVFIFTLANSLIYLFFQGYCLSISKVCL